MRILKNQTVYQCEYCNKRLLSKNGARIHESQYCKDDKSPNMTEFKKKQETCPHDNVETVYGYIPGEAVKQPEYDLCIDCGMEF